MCRILVTYLFAYYFNLTIGDHFLFQFNVQSILHFFNFCIYYVYINTYYVSKREIWQDHEPKASEMSRNISCEMSVISDLSYTDECSCAVES